ncbi:MAG: DUF2235 domain-containing protein, partial [Merismopediaceae bacterium]|nr:DUF2235 domain-containing protein [Merismopediaceae bacterium]
GAYTVRSLAGLIYNCGILQRENIMAIPEAIEKYRSREPEDHPVTGVQANKFRQNNALKLSNEESQVYITLLGCWDTVGSLGIPDFDPYLPIDEIINSKYRFHDTTINPKIQNALHAVAIDEKRKVFDVTPMELSKHSSGQKQKLKQVWFPGDHGCVGGGQARKDGEDQACDDTSKVEPNYFAQVTLKWMVDSIKELGLGLEFNEELIGKMPADEQLLQKFPFENKPKNFLDKITERLGMQERDIASYFCKAQKEFNSFHETVKLRYSQYLPYKPKNLQGLLDNNIE